MTGPLYKGEPLEAARGPGLGCFWTQVTVLAVLLVVTPLGVVAGWPLWLTSALLIVTLIMLLFAGQTVIFLLRLVAADRRTRRRPLAATARRTVGDLEAGVPADDAAASWTALDLPLAVRPLFDGAITEARRRLEADDALAPFDRSAEAGDGSVASARIAPARLRLPGLRRPTDAIRIDLEGADPPSHYRVAIRYESEGPHRYRYWPPVMAVDVANDG